MTQIIKRQVRSIVSSQSRHISFQRARDLFVSEDNTFPTNYTEADLKRIYLKLAKKYHPDVQGGSKQKF